MHEAGHAVLCHLLGVKVKSVTVEWSGTSHGALVYVGTPQLDKLLRILLAGEAAVAHAECQRWFDDVAEQERSDPADQRDGMRVTSDAENVASVLERLHAEDPEARERTLGAARAEVDSDVERHWPQVRLLAEALLRETTLTGRQIRRILGSSPATT